MQHQISYVNGHKILSINIDDVLDEKLDSMLGRINEHVTAASVIFEYHTVIDLETYNPVLKVCKNGRPLASIPLEVSHSTSPDDPIKTKKTTELLLAVAEKLQRALTADELIELSSVKLIIEPQGVLTCV